MRRHAEKFEQAVDDYKTALALKTELLPASSRQLTEVHYKLCLVLDMTPGRLDEAIEHAQKAVDSTEARLEELRAALDGQAPVAEAPVADRKGKGKAGPSGLRLGTDLISAMTKAQVEAEIKDVEELRGELKAKVSGLANPLPFW
jgi:HAT1-interacting factor 1